MTGKRTPPGFGLFIVGNEILDGRVADSHFTYTVERLGQWNIPLRYALVLPDDADILEAKLRWAMDRPEPFFCCGGIGSTPDDLTRDCAARAAGVPLEHHAEGVALLKKRFGDVSTPERLRMAEFPKGADLVPNPVNQVSGFSIQSGYFLPGFPSMAAPMMAWVLETYYERGPDRVAMTLVLPTAKEADLVPVMEAFIREYPDLSFSSLPKFVQGGTEVHLTLTGPPDRVRPGLENLTSRLDAEKVPYEKT